MSSHTCWWRVISHTRGWDHVLVSCGTCFKTEAWTKDSSKMKIKIGERRYRPMSTEEFREHVNKLGHLCCE